MRRHLCQVDNPTFEPDEGLERDIVKCPESGQHDTTDEQNVDDSDITAVDSNNNLISINYMYVPWQGESSDAADVEAADSNLVSNSSVLLQSETTDASEIAGASSNLVGNEFMPRQSETVDTSRIEAADSNSASNHYVPRQCETGDGSDTGATDDLWKANFIRDDCVPWESQIAATDVFAKHTDVLTNPVAALMMGALVTALVQSSSTTVSITVSMVGASVIDIETAIPVVLGANLCSSMTTTLVSAGQIWAKSEFRRAFAGSVLHDMFTWLVVIVLLPIEVTTGYLQALSSAIARSLHVETKQAARQDILRAITKPFTDLIIQINKNSIEDLAKYRNRGEYLLQSLHTDVGDPGVGAILLVISLVLLMGSLLGMVQTLRYLLKGPKAVLITKFINADFSGLLKNQTAVCVLKYLTGYVAIIVGVGLAMVVQSSSIFTAILIPLVGIGIIELDRMYDLTLGSNVGAAVTTILSAMVTSGTTLQNSLQLAFCNLFFNITGILILYPITYFRFPIRMAKFLGNLVAEHRWLVLVYPLLMFYAIPAMVFGLSLTGWRVQLGILCPIALLIIVIGIFKVIQAKAPPLPVAGHGWLVLVYLLLILYGALVCYGVPTMLFGLYLAGWGFLIGVLCPIVFLIIVIVIFKTIQAKTPQWLPTFLRSLYPCSETKRKVVLSMCFPAANDVHDEQP